LHEFGSAELRRSQEILGPELSEMPSRGAQESIAGLFDELDRNTSQLGAFHPLTLATINRLAIAPWNAGDAPQAVAFWSRQFKRRLRSRHRVRCSLLCTLGEVMVDQSRWGEAAMIYREVLQSCVRWFGAKHPHSLAAKGDLAGVLFELGEGAEAAGLEQEAWEGAREHLGSSHEVTCVLAWNRARRLKENGDGNAAQTILVEHLSWLLTADDANLESDHLTVKALLAARWGWQTAKAC
jgi:Tetratricopeptide repeat